MIESSPPFRRMKRTPRSTAIGATRGNSTIGDIGVGECAGEVVYPIDFELVACEREVFEAQLQLDGGNIEKAARMAYESMLHGAQALLKFKFADRARRSRTRSSKISARSFYDTEIFFDPFVRGKFAQDFFQAHEEAGSAPYGRDGSPAHRRGAIVYRGMLQLPRAHDGGAREGHRVIRSGRSTAHQSEDFRRGRRRDSIWPTRFAVFHQWIGTASARRC